MATIDIYDKGQTDALLAGKADAADLPSAAELVPDYSGASADDVLTIENGAPVWKAAGGSGGRSVIETITFATGDELRAYASNLNIGDRILDMTINISGEISTFRDMVVYSKDSTTVYLSGSVSRYAYAQYYSGGFTTRIKIDSSTQLLYYERNTVVNTDNIKIQDGTTFTIQKSYVSNVTATIQKFA